MVSSLNLAYIHLRLEELFDGDEWFGSTNMLFMNTFIIRSNTIDIYSNTISSINIYNNAISSINI